MGKSFKKIIRSVLTVVLSVYLMGYATGAFAYSGQALYDDVWKLVQTKYLDSEQNHQNWNRWRHKYDNQIKTDKDAHVAIQTMLASLNDPYTRYLDPEEFAEEGNSIKGTLYGIGIQIGIKEDKLMVISPIEDTPAYKAGLQANDEIIEINGKNTKGITVKDAADQIRGEIGTKVNLKVKRDTQTLDYSVARDKINVKAVSVKPPKNSTVAGNIGYIKLNSFISSNAGLEVKNALTSMPDKAGYILDLRSNPGGLLTNAISISNMFLNNGVIVSTVDREGYKETQRSIHHPITDKPLVVLIDGGSASASEILSGALKDNGRATLVGAKSFGKGLVQEINRLPDGSGMNITIQKYLTPNGTDINKVGISPDVEVKATPDDIKKNNDVQFQKAQEVLKELISQGKSGKSQQMTSSPLMQRQVK